MQEQLRIVVFIVVLVGILLAAVSLLADPLELGATGSGFGWKQITGTVIGLALAVGGLLLWQRIDSNEADNQADSEEDKSS